jgi:hypothetical protein
MSERFLQCQRSKEPGKLCLRAIALRQRAFDEVQTMGKRQKQYAKAASSG